MRYFISRFYCSEPQNKLSGGQRLWIEWKNRTNKQITLALVCCSPFPSPSGLVCGSDFFLHASFPCLWVSLLIAFSQLTCVLTIANDANLFTALEEDGAWLYLLFKIIVFDNMWLLEVLACWLLGNLHNAAWLVLTQNGSFEWNIRMTGIELKVTLIVGGGVFS